MAYATVAHVQALNAARRITGSSMPSATQVVEHLEHAAAVLDSILRVEGYALPIATTATGALDTMKRFNAAGGHFLTEQSAPTKEKETLKAAERMWEQAQEMLKAGGIELDAAQDEAQALPRGPLMNATPMFTVDQDF